MEENFRQKDSRWQMVDGRWGAAARRQGMADGRWQMVDGRW
jgi:hypothetical protein